MRVRAPVFAACLAWGCVPDDAALGDSDVSAETDVAAPVDTLADETDQVDTDSPDTDGDTEHAADTDVAGPQPPSTWGVGLVDISTSVFLADGVTVVPGDPATSQSPQAARLVFADLDSDGLPELLVDASLYGGNLSTRELRIYRYTSGLGLVRDAALETPFEHAQNQAFLGALDLDGDGHDDLVQETANPVWWSDGDGGFAADSQISNTGVLSRAVYTSLSVLDVDADGWLDLVVGSDGCAWSYRVFQQTGPHAFTVRTDLLDSPEHLRLIRVAPMVRGDGSVGALAVGTACELQGPSPGGFLTPSALPAADGALRWRDQDLTPADVHWKLVPRTAGLPFAAVMPMGGITTDLDGDRRPDVILSLGDDYLVVLKALASGSFVDASSVRFAQTQGIQEVPWGVVAPDLDRDGVPDLIVAMGDDAGSFHRYNGVMFSPRVYWGAGDLSFQDVTTAVAMDIAGSWHGLVLDDLDGDLDPDVAVGGYGNPSALLRNDIEVPGHALVVRLQGTTSNPLGLGAVIEVEAVGIPARAQVMGGEANPEMLPRAVTFFGLGPATQAAVVRVRWPSGVVQELYDVLADQALTLTEPASIVLSEGDRHLPADGASELSVRVWPRGPAGHVRAASTVTLSLDGGGVVISAPEAQPDGSWAAVVRAPHATGSTRIEASVDGVAYKVAPRVWWD